MQSSRRSEHDWIRSALIALALAYAFLAGFKTVADYDVGWQLATGRYIVEHHTVPSTDVLSYTARGTEWIYPQLSAVILYWLTQLGGWSALSWLNALACAGVIALLVFPAGRLAALLALLAVPVLSYATEPRSEVFTTLIFAASFSLLWRHYRGERVHLWVLPMLFALWANFHTGFASGIALLAGYVLLELLELPFPAGRAAALERLKRGAAWCVAAALATLVNPWGYRLYVSLVRQNEASGLHDAFIGHWSAVKLNSAALRELANLRDSASGYWWLLLAACAAAVVAIGRRRIGPAVLLAGGAYLSLSHIRFQGLFALLAVTIAGSLPPMLAGEDWSWLRALRAYAARREFQLAVAALATLLVGVRCFDLVSNRHYIIKGEVSLFGAGPSWWYPERAAAFLLRERLPGNVFNDFNLGGYLAYRIGPEYPVYVDGRYIPFGADFIVHKNGLMASPPDSTAWTDEADRRGINLAIFSLSRYGELENAPLTAFCASKNWKPVYLDEVSVIFMRVREQNQPWLSRLALDCKTAPLNPPAALAAGDAESRGHAELFEYYANAGSVLYVLSRDAEASAALDRANQIFPDDPNLHLIRGQFFEATGRATEAEKEYRASLDLTPTDAAWQSLGRLYGAQHRYAEAAECFEKSAELSTHDYDRYRVLGQIYLAMKQPQRALEAFDRAQRHSPFEKGAALIGVEFHARLAENRAHAWQMLGNTPRAVAYAEEAVRLTPENAARWQVLADLYTIQGRTEDAARARDKAK